MPKKILWNMGIPESKADDTVIKNVPYENAFTQATVLFYAMQKNKSPPRV
jgi:hypothetical protein